MLMYAYKNSNFHTTLYVMWWSGSEYKQAIGDLMTPWMSALDDPTELVLEALHVNQWFKV